MTKNMEKGPSETNSSTPEFKKPKKGDSPVDFASREKLDEDARRAEREEVENPKKINDLKQEIDQQFKTEKDIVDGAKKTGDYRKTRDLSWDAKKKLFEYETTQTADPKRRQEFLSEMRTAYEKVTGEKGLSDEEIIKKAQEENIETKNTKESSLKNSEKQGVEGRESKEDIDFKEDVAPVDNEAAESSLDSGKQGVESGESAMADKIKNANSLEELIDILKPIKRGFGFSLANGGFYRGKFGGQPIAQTISRIEEIRRVAMSLPIGHAKNFGDFVDNGHIAYNLEDVPEEGGLKDKVKFLLGEQQKINEQEADRQEKERENNINLEEQENISSYYEALGLPSDSSMEEIQSAYRALAAKTHPDAGGKAEDFKKVNEAYEFLKERDNKK